MTSEEEFEAKFPGQKPDGIPPSPTPENPGQVYPMYDIQDDTNRKSRSHSHEVTAASNPFLLRSAPSKLHQCLTDTISVLESDESANATCREEEENSLLAKLRMWRRDLDGIQEEHSLVDSSRPQLGVPPTPPSRTTTNGYSGPAPGSGIFAD